MERFLSPEPEAVVVNMFSRPYENAVAAARTCYSANGVVRPEDVSGDALDDAAKREKRITLRDKLARDIFEAGHHTTFQHAHVQFALSNVSRHFIWAFLHAHPFYNSEQVSQRYVEVKEGNVAVPPLPAAAREIYEGAVAMQMDSYRRLMEMLAPEIGRRYYALYPSRLKAKGAAAKKNAQAIQKRAQETARYVLPVATFAYLYHTVSAVTLLRYAKMCRLYDAPVEQRMVVEKMTAALLALDPLYGKILDEPLSPEETPEHAFFQSAPFAGNGAQREFAREFDAALGGRVSLLADYKARNEESLAQSVREVLGVPRAALSDDDAVALALDPAKNPMLGATLNLTTHGKLSRCLFHPSYTFRKKLSHTADSQDQRHRMTPASRPCLSAYASREPDYVTPQIIAEDEGAARRLYDETMERTWDAIGKLRTMNVPEEFSAYLLPNAVAIRFTESSDLLNLHHKHKMRLCYNAQEEIWRASLDEALQISEVNPRIGRWLLPPCGIRDRAGTKPLCPEAERYCGVKVWKTAPKEYRRTL